MKDELSKIHQAADLVKICKDEGVKIPRDDGRDYSDKPYGRANLRGLIRDHRAEQTAEAEKLAAEKAETTETRKGVPVWAWALIILATAFLLWGIFRPRPTPAPADLSASIADLSGRVEDLEAELEVLAAEPEVKAPVVEAEEPAKIPDTVAHFYDLATFYIDGDPKVDGFKVQEAEMKYTCENSYGVFITMDPGVVSGKSTGDLGAVFFVACKKGDVVTISTPHWSDSALHQQIHLVEFTQEITAEQALTFLKVLKLDEGKEVAFFIDAEGNVTKY